jgi:hypothetical protein
MALQLKHRSLFELIGIAQSLDATRWIKRIHNFGGAFAVAKEFKLVEFKAEIIKTFLSKSECTWYVQGGFAHSYKEALILAIEFELS